jgi:ribosomal protein L19
MNSRQIVDLIKKESQKETDERVVAAYNRLIDRIEVLEDIDMSRGRERFNPAQNVQSNLTREEAMAEFNRLFKV